MIFYFCCGQMDIKGKFYICDNPLVDPEYGTLIGLNGGCETEINFKGKFFEDNKKLFNVTVLTRKPHEVSGIGYACDKKLVSVETFENFFGAKSVKYRRRTIRV